MERCSFIPAALQIFSFTRSIINIFFSSFQPNGDPYAFIEFTEHQAAAAALAAMNKRSCFGKVSRKLSVHFFLPCPDAFVLFVQPLPPPSCCLIKLGRWKEMP